MQMSALSVSIIYLSIIHVGNTKGACNVFAACRSIYRMLGGVIMAARRMKCVVIISSGIFYYIYILIVVVHTCFFLDSHLAKIITIHEVAKTCV